MLLCGLVSTVFIFVNLNSEADARITVTRSELRDVLNFLEMDTGASSDVKVEYLGCFKDISNDRALEKLYYMADKSKGNVVEQCAKNAKAAGYEVFGVQYYSECWASKKNGFSRYKKYGPQDPSECLNGIGGGDTNAVYRIKAVCHANGVNVTDGQTMFIPNRYDNVGDATCKRCTCVSGNPNECHIQHCDLHRRGWCEKYGPTPPGKCCPKCECVHKGREMAEGASWISKLPGGYCAECTCLGGTASCNKKHVLCPVCENPVPTEGQCCDVCRAPTTRGPVTIILKTTQKPTFVLPPRPPWAVRDTNDYHKQEDVADDE